MQECQRMRGGDEMAKPICDGRDEESFTMEKIETFIKSLQKTGRPKETQDAYRRALKGLYEFLPLKCLSISTWEDWKQEMQEQGLQIRTINNRLSVYNSYLRFIGRKSWCDNTFLPVEEKMQTELTRNEYRRLLSAARHLGKEKTYLVIKVMGGFGLTLQELPKLTVEAVKIGELSRAGGRSVRLTEALQTELLAYTRERGNQSGPIFQTSSGRPIDRTSIYHLINSISAAALVDPTKATPSGLCGMYRQTRKEIEEHMMVLADQSYQRMLEDEQRTLGWEDETSL